MWCASFINDAYLPPSGSEKSQTCEFRGISTIIDIHTYTISLEYKKTNNIYINMISNLLASLPYQISIELRQLIASKDP